MDSAAFLCASCPWTPVEAKYTESVPESDASVKSSVVWHIDSGAGSSITGDLSLFTSFTHSDNLPSVMFVCVLSGALARVAAAVEG